MYCIDPPLQRNRKESHLYIYISIEWYTSIDLILTSAENNLPSIMQPNVEN